MIDDTVFCSLPAFQTEGKVYLILDFLRGGDLFTRLSKEVSQKYFGRSVSERLSTVFMFVPSIQF